MILKDSEKDFNLVVIDSDNPMRHKLDEYNAIFQTWDQVWQQGVLDLYNQSFLSSDHFVRQDFVAGIFCKRECIGSCSYRLMDLNLPAHRADSWFRPWPKLLIEDFSTKNNQVLVPSWLTVHQKYRRKSGFVGIDVAKTIMELLNFFLREFPVTHSFGVSRNDRSVYKILEHISGHSAAVSSVNYEGFDVDLFIFEKSNMESQISKFDGFTEYLWENRSDFRRFKLEEIDYYDSNIQVSNAKAG